MTLTFYISLARFLKVRALKSRKFGQHLFELQYWFNECD